VSEWSQDLTHTHTHTECGLKFKSTCDAQCVASDIVSSDNSMFPAKLCSIFELVSQIVQPSMGLDPWTIQLTASRYTDYTFLSCKMIPICLKNVLYRATKTVKSGYRLLASVWHPSGPQALLICNKMCRAEKALYVTEISLHFRRHLRTKFLAVR